MDKNIFLSLLLAATNVFGDTPSKPLPPQSGHANEYLQTDGTSPHWNAVSGSGSGTVTSVNATVPSYMSISGGPITTSGALAFDFSSQTQKKFFAAPNASSGAPGFRTILASDVPTLNQSTTGNADTATALALNPVDCSSNQFANAIAANGDLTCTQVAYSQLTGAPSLHYQTIQANTTPQTQRTNLNFTSNFSFADSLGSDRTTVDLASTISANVIGALTGNADTATSAAKWTTARNLAGNSVDGSAAVAFANKFIVQGTTDAGLSSAQFLGALGTGIVKNTTTTGVLSIAVAGDFPTLNQSTSGNAATATALAADPTDCGANTFATTIDANGNLSCAAVGDGALSVSYVKADGTRGLSADWNAGAHSITATTFVGALTGNSSTATALAANPTDCGSNTFATTIDASGNLSCSAVGDAALSVSYLKADGSRSLSADWNAGAHSITATSFIGALTGNADTATSAAKWTTARNLAGNSVDGSAAVAFANKFIVQGTTDAGLSAAQFLGALGTGIVKNTTTTGVLSIAVAGDFPTLNQSTSGNAATATALAADPTDCGSNTFATTIDASGNLSCSAVGDAALSVSYLKADGSRGLSANWDAGAHTITATTFIGALTGNADTATSAAKWTTARNLAGNSVDGSGNVAFSNKYIVQGTTDSGLSGAQFLGALGTGIVKNTTTTGILSIAVAGDFPTLNQSTSGNAATATALAANPSDCGPNTFATTIDASGNLTCSAVADAALSVSYLKADGSRGLSADWNAGAHNITATSFVGSLTGNADTATSAAKWTTARNLAGNSVDGSAAVAFANKFIVQGTADAGLSSAQFLGALGTGIVKNTTTTGVLSIASAGDFPTLNQNTSGTAAGLSTTLVVGSGGTGLATLTAHSVQIGNGTSNVTQLTVGPGGTLLQGVASADPTFTATPTLGVATSVKGTLGFAGNTSGTVTVTPAAAAGTYNFVLPITAGNAGQLLTSQGGGTTAMTWTSSLTNPMSAQNDMIYSTDGSGTPGRIGIGATGTYLKSQGASTIPIWAAFTAPTVTLLTSNGSVAGYVFTVTSATASAGDTYTNNAHTYTVLKSISAGTTLYMTGASAPTASGNLVRSSGAGTDPIVFSANLALTAYTTPATAKAIWVRCVGAGGAGGGAIATGASQNACGAGGGGGGYTEKLIASPEATYYYYIPPAITGVAGTTGTAGATVHFAGASNALTGLGGNGGSNSAVCGGGVFCTTLGGSGGGAAGGDLNIPGSGGGACLSLTGGTQSGSGSGGASVLGQPGYASALNITNSAGISGGNYGAGGSGGNNSASQASTRAGGTSSQGGCFLMEIYNGN